MRRVVVVWFGILLASAPLGADTFTAFGPGGEGGAVNGQSYSIGTDGEVFELDAFLNVGGLDLNGATAGTSAQLSIDALPAGLAFGFSAALQPGGTSTVLTYTFTNGTGALLGGVTFLSYLDADIAAALNSFFNEFGEVSGAAGAGDPDSFEIDEPGFFFGDIFDNLRLGALDDANAVPVGSPEDVAMALGFSLGDLVPGATATIQVMISSAGDRLGGFWLTHRDAGSQTTVTFSGNRSITGLPAASQPVPEPSTMFLGAGILLAWCARRRARDARRASK